MFVCKVAGVLFIAFDIPLQGFFYLRRWEFGFKLSILFVRLCVCSRNNPHRVRVCEYLSR